MLKIGDFSRLAHVTVKALRHYARLGLFKPAWIDRYSGYRYYNLGQLPRLNRILALKQLGFSLDQVRGLLDKDLSADELRGMLRMKRVELEDRMVRERLRLAQVEARLHQIEQEGAGPRYEVVVKRVDPVYAVTLRVRMPDLERSYERCRVARDDLLKRLPPGLRLASYWLVTSLGREWDERGQELQVAVPVEGEPGRKLCESFSIELLPGAEHMASAIHMGSPALLPEAYTALYAWAEANRCRPCGPAREVYLEDPSAGTANSLVEVQLPVESLLAHPPVNLEERQERIVMEPKIVERPAFTIVGMRYYGKNQNKEIPKMWEEVIPRFGEIPQTGPRISYGYCSMEVAADGSFEYIAGLETAETPVVPEGMLARLVPAQKYAVFVHRGELKGLPQTWKNIQEVWMPAAGLERANGPDFEAYEEGRFIGDVLESELEIWVPVK